MKQVLPARWVFRLREIIALHGDGDAAEANVWALAKVLYGSEEADPPDVEVVDRHSPINHYELRLHSQNGEDGILLRLLGRTGMPSRRFVELGVGTGRECNTATLAFTGEWSGLWVDQSARNVELAKYYSARMLGSKRRTSVAIVRAHLTAENVNQVLSDAGYDGEVDLLSIDVDGMDYWLWRAIEVTSPRVVVVEYNATFGPERSVTVPYDPGFDYLKRHHTGFYHGASLVALTKLADRKGYLLVGCDSSGANAFYVRKDVALNRFSAVEPRLAYYPERRRSLLMSTEDQFRCIEALPVLSV